MYSPTVLQDDPKTFIPDPSEYDNHVVTNWGIKDFTKNHDLLATAILHHMTLSSDLYGDQGGPTMQFIKVLEKRKLDYFNNELLLQAGIDSTFYVVKIQVCENENDVWRRFRVPASIDLAKLSDQVISPIMGWSRCYKAHVFEDPKDGSVIGSYPSEGKYAGHMDALLSYLDYYYLMDDRKLPLALLLRNVGDYAFYTHDLAEQWVHKITVEEVLHDCADDCSVLLLDGSGACPPENGTGVEARGCLGYAEFLRLYKKNPKKPKVKQALREMRTAHNYATFLIGTSNTKFDPLYFDINLHRRLLDEAVAGPSLRITGALFSTIIKVSTTGCAGCGNRLKALHKCSGCAKAAYCSRDCQVKDWKEGHRKVCGKRK